MKQMEHDAMEPAKEIYESIQIPRELNDVVSQAIRSVDKKRVVKKNRQQALIRGIQYAGGIAAGLLVMTTIGLNTSQTFAQTLSEIPVVGAFAKVLTVRSYTEQEENTTLTVKSPEIQKEETADAETAPADEFITDINAEINQIVDDYIALAQQELEDYKQAFLETGGTEEEWNERPIDINVTYDVKYQNGPYLSLVLYNSQSWASFTEEQVYYNLDLQNDRTLTLKDLLGEDYIAVANASILEQIQERIENDDLIFWGFNDAEDIDEVSIDGFTTIDDTASFYINADGNPVITFPKYSIGPGYIGVQEFEIPNSILSTP